MPTKPLSALRTKMTPEAQARSRARAKEMIERGMTLRELREQAEVTQTDLAERAHTSQSEVSKIEQRTDLMISTLRDYMHGLGAELVLVARFPDGGTIPVRLPGDAVAKDESTTKRVAVGARG